MKRIPERESDIQHGIIEYLELIGALVVKVNNTGIMKANGSYIPPREKGIADILCCYRGRFYAIEVKRPGGKVTPYQEAFLVSVRKAGGIPLVAYSLQEVINEFSVIHK